MKLITLFLGMLLSVLAQAKAPVKIAFLTSIDPKDGKMFFHGKNYNNNEKFEKEFRSRFLKRDFDIQVKHFATVTDIWNVLHDESISAVFFLSHSAESMTKSGGALKSPALIADYKGNDLKNAFQKVHGKLKYLAVIGCDSQSIIEDFKKLKTYANAPDLVIKSFDDKIRPSKGLNSAIDGSIGIISQRSSWCEDDSYELCIDGMRMTKLMAKENFKANRSLPRIQQPRMVLAREIPVDANPETIRPSFVLIKNKVVGFFPKGLPGEVQEIEVDEVISGKVSLNNDSGLSSRHKKQDITLGELKIISSTDQCELKAERNRKGEILGIGKHYYQLMCH